MPPREDLGSAPILSLCPSSRAAVGSARGKGRRTPVSPLLPGLVVIIAVLTAIPVTASSIRDPRGSGAPAVSSSANLTLGGTGAGDDPLVVSSTLALTSGQAYPGNYSGAEDSLAPERLAYGGGDIFVAGEGSSNISIINDSTNEWDRTIELNNSTKGLAFDPGLGELFVGKAYCAWSLFGFCLIVDGAVVIVDSATGQGLAWVGLPSVPSGVAFDPVQGELYVALPGLDQVAILSTSTNTLTGNVTVGTSPTALAYDTGTGQIFVANFGSDNVSVVNASTHAVVANVAVGNGPVAVEYDRGQHEIFVADRDADNVSVVSDQSDLVVANLSLGYAPLGLAYVDRHSEVVVVGANNTSGFASVVDDHSNTITATIATDVDPGGDWFDAVVYDEAKDLLFVTNSASGEVIVLSSSAAVRIATVTFIALPDMVAFDSGRDEVFVTDVFSGNVFVVSDSTDRLVATVGVGDASGDLAYDPALGEVFVANQYWGNLSVISDTNNTIVGSIELPQDFTPYGLAYDSAKGELFVSNYDGSNVSIVNAATGDVVASVAVGSTPMGLAYDPAQGEVFVVDYGSGQVSIISDSLNRVVRTITLPAPPPIGSCPWSLAYDPRTAQVFVGDGCASLVDIISATSNSMVGWVRLPVLLNTNDIESLAYDPAVSSILVPDDLGETPDEAVVGVLSDQSDHFTQWISVPPRPGHIVYASDSGAAYLANFFEGTLFRFTRPTLAFREAGLPDSSTWFVNLSRPIGSGSNLTWGTTGAVSFTVPNGTVTFAVAPPEGYGVSLVTGPAGTTMTSAVVSGLTTVGIWFAPVETIYLNETGLPWGPGWCATLTSPLGVRGPAAQATCTPTSSLSFDVTSGTYRYMLTAPPGFAVCGSVAACRPFGETPGSIRGLHGTLRISWPTTYTVTFYVHPTRAVTFAERGLPRVQLLTTGWWVDVTGSGVNGTFSWNLTSHRATVTFLLSPGSYTWSVGTGHSPPIEQGSIRV